MRHFSSVCLLIFFSVSCHSAEHDAVRRAVESGRYKPLAEILETVEKRCPGRILDVDMERNRDGRAVYEVKTLGSTGLRCELHVDAVSGELIENDGVVLDERQIWPLADILRAVLARHPGHVIDVELERGERNRIVYEVKIALADGRVRELSVDALNGKLLESDEGRELVPQTVKPLPDVLDSIHAKYPGIISEAELEHDRDGRYYYEIEIRMADGNMLELHVDATSGEIFREEVTD